PLDRHAVGAETTGRAQGTFANAGARRRSGPALQNRPDRASLARLRRRSLSREAVAQRVARRGTTRDIQTGATPDHASPACTRASSIRATSARLLTGVEESSQDAARGLCDSLA